MKKPLVSALLLLSLVLLHVPSLPMIKKTLPLTVD